MGLGSEPSRCESEPVGSWGGKIAGKSGKGVFSGQKSSLHTRDHGEAGASNGEPGGFSDFSLGSW